MKENPMMEPAKLVNPTPSLAEMTLIVAREKVGVKEIKGSRNDGPFMQELQRWAEKNMGLKPHFFDNAPYCVMFATWCHSQAAKRLGVKPKIPPHASTYLLIQWCKKKGILTTKPGPYMIAMYHKDLKRTQPYHTFLTGGPGISAGGNKIWGIDGNWGNMIQKTKHDSRYALFAPLDF